MSEERKKTWDQKVDLVRNSYLRSKNNQNFAKLFYNHLFFLNPKLKDYFKNTDFNHQERALINGLDFLFDYFGKDENAKHQILRLAKVHNIDGLNIHPHFYYYWGEALVLAIKDSDPQYYSDMEYYLREVVSYPLSFFSSQYFVK